MTRVLVVDDEAQLVRALAINLRARAYEVRTAATGAAALADAARHPPDLVVLDLGLPDMDGVDVVQGIRGWSAVPILVLSAREGQADKVAALDAGADDYVTKPFGMDELLARVRAALRRANPGDAGTSSGIVVLGEVTVDLGASTVTGSDGEIRLTPTEWHLLTALLRRPGKLVTQRQLLQEVWGPAYSTESHYLRVYMAQLRRKLEPDPSKPRHLVTEAGMGYRFDP
jgi:two-component system KDP operon response regulator KdpE